MKTDITLSPMVLLKRGVQVAVDCVNNPISNYKFSLLDFNSKTEYNSILKTIYDKIDHKVLLNTTYRQIKFVAAELSADITSDAVWATVRRLLVPAGQAVSVADMERMEAEAAAAPRARGRGRPRGRPRGSGRGGRGRGDGPSSGQ